MKLLNKIIVTFILMSVINSVSFGKTNDDIIGHWAENTLNEWIEEEYIRGYPNGEIRPDNHMLKSECVALINRIFGFKIIGDRQFDNINEDYWYSNDFKIAKLAGYLSWMNENQMEINKPITRNEVAAIMAQIYHWDLKNYDNTLKQFKDEKEIPIWARKYVGLAVERGYFKGYPDGTIKSNKVMTRAEIAVFINNILGNRFKENEFVENQIFEGNVTIQEANVILENCEIKGDLLVAESVGNGDLTLENTKVFGRTIANGGGTDSIKIINSQIEELIVLKLDGEVRVFSKNSKIGQTIINSVAKLEGSFENIIINILSANGSVEIDGTCETLIVDSQVHIEVDKQTQINKVILNSESKITGEGTIKLAEINKNGVVVESKIEKKVLKDGVELNKKNEKKVNKDKVSIAKPIISGIIDGIYRIDQKFTIRGEENNYIEYSLDSGATWYHYENEVVISKNGKYKVLARQKDSSGNISKYTDLITIILNKDMPVFKNVDDDGDNTYRSGEKLSIVVEMNRQGLELSADLSVINPAFSSDEKLIDLGNGKYQLVKSNIDENGTMINEGLVIINIKAKDSNGFSVTDKTLKLFIDKTPPNIPSISGIISGLYNKEQAFSIKGDAENKFMYSLDNGSSWEIYENEVKIVDGVYKILAKAIDKCGNESGLTNVISVSIDKIVPNIVSIQDRSGNNYYKNNDLLDLIIDFDEVGLEVKADLNLFYGTNNDLTKIVMLNDEGNGKYRLLNQTISQITMAEGKHKIKIIAKDKAGNLKEDDTFVSILDFTLPKEPIITGISTGLFTKNQRFRIVGEEDAYLEYSLDNGLTWKQYLEEVMISGNGQYKLLARQKDLAGNISEYTNLITFTINKDMPIFINIDDDGGDNNYKSGEELSIIVEMNKSGLKLFADLSVINSAFSSDEKLTDLGNGKYQIIKANIDENGTMINEGLVTITITAETINGLIVKNTSFNLLLDKIDPTIPKIEGILQGFFKEEKVFSISGDVKDEFMYSIDNGSNWIPYENEVKLKDGIYNLLAKAIDKCGNESGLTNVINISIDTKEPTIISIQDESGNSYYKHNELLDLVVDFGEVGLEVKADLNLLYGTNNDQSKIILLNDEGNGEYRLLNQRINQAIMNEGEYNIKIIAKDAVGNLKEDNTFIGTLDFTVPEKPVITGITSGLFKENQVFEVEGERDSIIEYSLNNGSNWEKYNVIVELINSGDYEILVRQTDLAGNVSAVTNLINITIDKEAPKGYLLRIDELNITPKNKNSIKIQISNCEIGAIYNYNIDDKDENTEAITGTGIINQTNIELNNIDLSSLSDGQITFSIYCVDEAGNIGDYESEIKDKVPYNNVSVIDERDYCNGIYGYFEKRNNKPAYRRFGSPNDEMIIVWEDSGYGIEWALKVYQNDSKRYIAYYYCSEDKPTPPKASPTNKHWYYMDEMISELTLTE